jgi:hypothetical protein
MNQETVPSRPGGGSLADLEKESGKSMLRNTSKERDSLTNTPASDSEPNRSKRTAEQPLRRAPGRYRSSAYWLIATNENGPLEVLTTGLTGGEEALPVFSYEEEAELFLWLGGVREDWQARETTAGELTSLLYGLCLRVKKVALDPLPEMLDEKTVGLVSLNRERFLDLLVFGRGRSPRSDRLRPWDLATDGRPRLCTSRPCTKITSDYKIR